MSYAPSRSLNPLLDHDFYARFPDALASLCVPSGLMKENATKRSVHSPVTSYIFGRLAFWRLLGRSVLTGATSIEIGWFTKVKRVERKTGYRERLWRSLDMLMRRDYGLLEA